MNRGVWKFSFPLYSSNDYSTFLKKQILGSKMLTSSENKNVNFFRKQLIGKAESFLKSNFDLN